MNQASRISGERVDQSRSDREAEIDNGGIRELSETEHRIRSLWQSLGYDKTLRSTHQCTPEHHPDPPNDYVPHT